MTLYRVTINFNGFVGGEEEYCVWANSQEEAEELALQEALADLSVVHVEEDEEDE